MPTLCKCPPKMSTFTLTTLAFFRVAILQKMKDIPGMLKDLNYSTNLKLITDRHDAKAEICESRSHDLGQRRSP